LIAWTILIPLSIALTPSQWRAIPTARPLIVTVNQRRPMQAGWMQSPLVSSEMPASAA
jgi:hypothetical protein